jgi:hypothetical protein
MHGFACNRCCTTTLNNLRLCCLWQPVASVADYVGTEVTVFSDGSVTKRDKHLMILTAINLVVCLVNLLLSPLSYCLCHRPDARSQQLVVSSTKVSYFSRARRTTNSDNCCEKFASVLGLNCSCLTWCCKSDYEQKHIYFAELDVGAMEIEKVPQLCPCCCYEDDAIRIVSTNQEKAVTCIGVADTAAQYDELKELLRSVTTQPKPQR